MKSTIVQYAGVVVGAAANLFLYTTLPAEYGLVQTLLIAANLVAPFAMLGSYGLAVKYFPVFSGSVADRRGFLLLLIAIAATGSLLYLALSPLVNAQWIAERFADTDPAYQGFIRVVPAITVLFVFIRLLVQYCSNYSRIVVPNLLEQFAFKLTLPLLLALFAFGAISIETVVYGVLVHYGLVLVALVAYLYALGGLQFGQVTAPIRAKYREMAGFAAFGIAGQLGGMLAFRIDVLMVGMYLGLAAAGKYAIALFLSEIVAKPFTNLRAIVGPQVARAWSTSDLPQIQSLYRRSCDNMLLVASYLFGGIWVCYPSIAQLAARSSALTEVTFVFFFLGLARVVDSATSINEHIITYSTRYRVNLYAILVLAGVNLALNVVLIPRIGIAGAAVASLISVGIYNVIKVVFAGSAFKLWPFGPPTYVIAAFAALAIAGVYYLPAAGVWYIDIPVRGGLLTLIYGLFVWYGKPSPELRALLTSGLARVGLVAQ